MTHRIWTLVPFLALLSQWPVRGPLCFGSGAWQLMGLRSRYLTREPEIGMPDKGGRSPQRLLCTKLTWGDGLNAGCDSALPGTRGSAFLTRSQVNANTPTTLKKQELSSYESLGF